MPAPTEQHAQDQRLGVSDARRRIDNFMARYGNEPDTADAIYSLGVFVGELNWSDLHDVLADADRDRQFAEAVRTEVAHRRERRAPNDGVVWLSEIDAISEHVYSAPCMAKEAK